MKGYLYVFKKNTQMKPFVTFITTDHVYIFSFSTFCASSRFFKVKHYKTRTSIVLYGVYLYDNALVQYILNFC